MPTHYSLLVPDAKSTGDKIEVIAPYDQSVIATFDTADQAAVELALQTAYALFRNRKSWLAPAKRIEILTKVVDIMTGRLDELALEAAREGGKPLIDSKVEAIRAIDSIKICIDCLRTAHGQEVPMSINAASAQRLAMTQLEPIGVVVAASAFNHPLNLIAHQIGPAIAAGCPVIVKPAEDTPVSCFNLVRIFHEAGLPEQWCQALLTSDHDVATHLIADQRVGFFSFIGSARVGWMLRSKLAAGTRCALEHGGSAPVIMQPDADLETALPLLAKGGFYHAGQVCVSVQRIFAHESIAGKVARSLANLADKLVVGDPTRADTEVGPLIRRREVERVQQWVDEAVDSGGQLLCGGKVIDGNCYAPTVLFNPPFDAKVSQLEIFAPVVCVYPYQSIDQAIEQANALPVAFQAAIFTSNIDSAMLAYKQLDASAIMVNDHTAFRVDWMPFAGLRQSGLGVGGIPYTFHDMQIEKMLVIKSLSL
jgi:acyl-CoA reductase-like NAD-dependent aldehyde dehydrogenase